jgi:mono/diheme cytochrome c family protein
MTALFRPSVAAAALAVLGPCLAAAATAFAETGDSGSGPDVAAFFHAHCVGCHGPEKSKGDVTLHDIEGDFASDEDVERWESIRDMLESGSMPPEDKPQPDDAARNAVVAWINAGLRAKSTRAAKEQRAPTVRRLTNFEYENTMRDLLGFHLTFDEDLPTDPTKPYDFNNTAEFMLLGPEQIEHYLGCARRAMASAIVDPEPPEVFRTRQEWTSRGSETGQGRDEITLWRGGGRDTPFEGIRLKGFPKTGEFRVRMKASAIFPPGVSELPLRLVMGYFLNENLSTLKMAPIGTAQVRASPDDPQIFEFRGRIENFPAQVGVARKGVPQPDTMTITPQNLYDDGTLNDANTYLRWPRRLEMPRAVVHSIEFEGPLVEPWPPEHHTRILFQSPLRESDPKAYVREVLARFMTRAYRRPATDEEVDRFVAIHDLVAPEMGSIEAAMRETLAMVLISPQFLLHTQADGTTVPHDYELASALSYFLWGSMPDEELLALAAQGKLDDDTVIAEQVIRLLADPRSADFVRNFTVQWMSLDKMKTVPINRDLFPRFLFYVEAGERAGTEMPYRPTIRDFLVDETVGFIAELIRRNANVLNIVDSDFAVLNQPLAAHYGVAGVQGDALRPVALTPDHRLGGLLTHGSVLVGNGTGSAPHPIYRAVWLREAILGDEVTPPPADVPALTDTVGESATNAVSIKDLLARHRTQESCNDCHARLDPWGIPFEQYNAIGRYQRVVPANGVRVRGFVLEKDADLAGYMKYLESINTVPVDAASRLPYGTEVNGLDELKQYILEHRSSDVATNVLRRLLSYATGRDLSFRDRAEVERIRQRLEKTGYPIQDMIIAICQSAPFRRSDP